MDDLKILIRNASESDYNFIMQSFLKTVRKEYPYSLCENEIFFRNYKPIIESFINNAEIAIIADDETADHIIGYVLYDYLITGHLVLHYIYIKQPFRRYGIASQIMKRMFNNLGQAVTLCTHAGWLLRRWRTKYKLVYDPFILRNRGNYASSTRDKSSIH